MEEKEAKDDEIFPISFTVGGQVKKNLNFYFCIFASILFWVWHLKYRMAKNI